MHWVGSCWRSLPLKDAGKNFLPDHTIYLPSLLIKHWQSTVRVGLRSLIRKNCDFPYHCVVSEDVFRAACRGSASSASSISDLPTEPEPTESSFQACSSYTANLFSADRPRLSSSGHLGKRRNRVV